ncbi:MAG: NAD(P)-dependent oxidoreductase [Lachnospiraceae bacterium]
MISYEGFRNKRILVTGATGLIGFSLIKALLEINQSEELGLHITALVRNREKALERFDEYNGQNAFLLLTGDVCREEIFCGQAWDYMVHGAGNAHPKVFAMQPVETMKANLLGTMNLLEHAVKQKSMQEVKKILFLSSGEIYGEAEMPDEKGWREECAGLVDSMRLRACYPESKRAAETLCTAYYKEYEIPAVVARLSYIYGKEVLSDNTRADAQFLRNALAGEDIIMKSEGMQMRSYCYVEDAVNALILLLLEGDAGEAYNVANHASVATIREYAMTLADVFQVGIKTELPDTLEKSGYSQMKKEVLNAEKLYELGWNPRYDLKAGMKKMNRKDADE